METYSILIVEDDAIIAEDLRDILEAEGYVITGVASNAEKASQLLKFRLPDLVLLDITLKQNSSGLDVAREINKVFKVQFVYITSYSDQATVDEAIETKPVGYIVKPFQSKDILPIVRLALLHHNANDADAMPKIEAINRITNKSITAKEYITLCLICEGKTNPEIADSLHISVNTVKTHIQRVFSKLGVSSKLMAVQAVNSLK